MNVLEHFVGAPSEFVEAAERLSGLVTGAPTHCWLEVLDLSSGGPAKRMIRLFFLRMRTAQARRRALRLGATETGTFGFYPALDAPTFVYDLAGAARTYVEGNMLPGTGRLRTLAIRVVAYWAGCDPRAGAVVVVGTKR